MAQRHRPSSRSELSTILGALTFVVFACASMAQLVVGMLLDRVGPRAVFLTASRCR